MKFGRLDDIEGIDFSLPDDDPFNDAFFQKQKLQLAKPKVFIGCPVWADKGYVGRVYPKKAQPKDYLYYYSRQFNAIELNSTHYNIPTLQTVHKWKESTPDSFKFCPKFTNSISHSKDFGIVSQAIDRFLEAVYEFGDKLGMSFVQLPPHFKTDRINDLYKFLDSLPTDLKLAVEVRHASWFAEPTARKEFFNMLEVLGMTGVITDSPGRRDAIHQRVTSNTVFVRFLGNNLHPTDYSRVEEWVNKIKSWLGLGINTVYFFMHEPEKHLCADITGFMIDKINKACALGLKAPQKVLAQPQQSLF